MSRERIFKLLPWLSTPLLPVLLFVIWDLFIKVFGISELVLPPPGTVLDSFVDVVQRPETWQHARVTTYETVVGFGLALLFGVTAGVVLGKIPWLELSLRPMIVASQVVPKVALIPLFVIWFGFGVTSKIIMAAMLAFFPIMLNVQLGVRSVDSGQREVMRSLNASRWQTFTNLELKSTLPYVFAGMEVGIVFAVIGTIVGEYLGGSEGLGYLVVVTLNQLNAPELFAVIILLSALGLALYFTVTSLKRFFIPWHESVYNKAEVSR
ncbi:ABC transporter permease [Nocardioides sp. WG-D5]